MSSDLVLTVLHESSAHLGYMAGFAITDQMIVAAGGVSNRAPTVLASSNARHFEPRKTPRELGLRDVMAVGDALWACGEWGQLAVSRDHGGAWKLFETETDGCLYGLAIAHDGAVWVVGDKGYAARVVGDKVETIDFGTTARLSAVYAVRDEVVVLGFDGQLRRWRGGQTVTVSTGATKPLTALAFTRVGTWVVVGDGGFIARSPDGAWFSRVKTDFDIDLEALTTLSDGRLVAVGDRGQILISSDDGRSWKGIRSDLTSHLWAVERFGGGVIIGGDDGLIVKLAPMGDETWTDRMNVFGGAKRLETVFAAGPAGFIEEGLAPYLEAIASGASHGEEVDAQFADEEDGEEEVDDDDDDEDDDDEDDDDEDDDEDDEEVDPEAFQLLSTPGDASDFEAIYGMPLPDEAEKFFELVDDADPWSTFEELRLDNPLRPDVGEHNLFELMVRRNQHAYLGTDLVEAFCGVFGIGSQRNGDTYHMELYEWDGPRQVLHYDHETHSFTGVFADSLDSVVYLAAVAKAHEDGKLSQDAFDAAIRKLRGKVAPTWHFSIEDKDPDFVNLEPKRRDTEFFFYRSSWITALLKSDGVTEIEDIPQLFRVDFNQVIPADQLPARFDACEKFIPTALYSMWRAYLFDEPELVRYLEIGQRHKARLVRDAAKLIEELRGGRNQLGKITDVRAWLAAFRALDLDPRRAQQRAVEADRRAQQEAQRKDEVVAEIAGAEQATWSELAWRWIGDGVAHRALLERFDREPASSAQIAALDELRELDDNEREVALPKLAAELSPELEAILVGSLVRGDDLAGVLSKPSSGNGHGGDDGDDDDDSSPGWDAIDAALEPIYHGVEPKHYGTVLPYMLGGNDPLHGISAYLRDEPVPHFHFVTYGFTDLFQKETDDPDESGFGFELTMRLRRESGDDEPPMWALNFLQNLARYVFGTGNRFASGHKMGLNGPIEPENDTKIAAVLFADDPELGELTSEFGKARFIQIVGITDDEYRLVQEWSTSGLADILRKKLPMLVTDLRRDSVLDDPALAGEIRQRVEAEGSLEDMAFAGDLSLADDGEAVRLELGALYAASLPRAMRGRIRHGREYELRGRNARLHLKPAERFAHHLDDAVLTLEMPPALAAEIEMALRDNLAGEYSFRIAGAIGLVIVVTPSFIRDQGGKVVDIKGIADPDEAKRLIEAENAKQAEEENDDEVDEDDEDDDAADEVDDDEEDEEGDDEQPPDRDKVIAALAMTSRAIKLAPGNDDIQFTHAMLLIDADRAGVPHKLDELIHMLPGCSPSVRINVAVRMGKLGHPRFADAVDIALSEALPQRILAEGGGGMMASFGDVAEELFSELGEAVLEHAPDRMASLIPMLPGEIALLAELAWKAIQAKHTEHAIALYDRVLTLPIPEDGDDRTSYLRAINNACVQAHAAKAYDAAVRIADRAQPVAHENPFIYHSAACAYAAVGDHKRAFEQVKLAVRHDYPHLAKVEVDTDLGPILEWPEFKELFRDWHTRREGN